jgi:hypothetical protein
MVFRSEAGAGRFSLNTGFSEMASDKTIGVSTEGGDLILSDTSGGRRVATAMFVAVESAFVEHVSQCRYSVFDAEQIMNGKESAAGSCAVTTRSARSSSTWP